MDSKKSGTPHQCDHSHSHSKPPPPPVVKDDKPLDELLDFIEGNRKSMNEKKRAKKERQKQQKIDEIRKREDEERKRKYAEEAERKRREEEAFKTPATIGKQTATCCPSAQRSGQKVRRFAIQAWYPN